jgi:hypothetical protein
MNTQVTSRHPWGTYVAARLLCSDGKVRSVSRIADTADTFYSVPATVKVAGRSVSGYMSFHHDMDDPEGCIAIFVAYTYGKNGHLLPRWPSTYHD